MRCGLREVLGRMPDVAVAAGADAINRQPELPERHAHLFRVGHSISGFEPIGGNNGRLLADSDATPETVEGWTWRRRLWNNAIAMLGPVL